MSIRKTRTIKRTRTRTRRKNRIKKGGTADNSFVIRKGNKIVKTYKKSGNENFKRELIIYLLAKQENLDFIPKLLNFDIKKRMIVTEYVGPTLNQIYKGRVAEKRKLIPRIKKLYKKLLKSGYHHNDIRFYNVCMRKDKMYLIDFEFSDIKYTDKNDNKIL